MGDHASGVEPDNVPGIEPGQGEASLKDKPNLARLAKTVSTQKTGVPCSTKLSLYSDCEAST